ncbi:hypothetical protein [Frankia sp. ACN10a]|nr:hypothetical protein [Frankia sp. ACN10a]
MQPSTATEHTEFDLDLSIVATGVTAVGFDSEECTSDNCTGTDDSAGVTC